MNKKSSISPCILLLFSLYQLHLPAAMAAPQINCPQPVYDFGEKSSRDTITHTFILENRGNQELVISKVTKTCGCTVVQLSTNRVAAGQTAALETAFDLRRRRGPQSKNFSILSNDPETPRLDVFLKGKAQPDMEAIPDALFFGTVGREEHPSLTFRLIINTTPPYRITTVKSYSNQIVATYQPEADGRAYLFTVQLADNTAPGALDDQVRIYTDHPDEPVVVVKVKGQLVGDGITVNPPRLRLPRTSPRPLVRRLVLSGNLLPNANAIKVLAPFTHERIEVKQTAPDAILVEIFGIQAETASADHPLVIQTTPGREGEIQVPLQISE